MPLEKRHLKILGSSARTTSGQTQPVDVSPYNELDVNLDITAVTGTLPTLDVKMQGSPDVSPAANRWFDIASGGFTQKTAVGKDQLRNLDISAYRSIRMVYTVGGTTPNFTFEVDVTVKE